MSAALFSRLGAAAAPPHPLARRRVATVALPLPRSSRRPRPCRRCRHCPPLAAAPSSSSTPQQQLTPEKIEAIQRGARQRRKLRKELEEAAGGEDYSRAAALRDELRALERDDPLLQTRRALEEAVAEERYGEAAVLRDTLRALEEQIAAAASEAAAARRAEAASAGASGGSPSPSSSSSSLPPPFSDTTTEGIRVVVRSAYVPSQSSPADGRFFFVYRVKITNLAGTGGGGARGGTAGSNPTSPLPPARTVQLRSRHWLIRDAHGRVDHVRGPGVVGEQPVLPPAASFEYESACPLRTATGSMEGEFEFVVLDGDDEEQVSGGGGGAVVVQAEIGRFGLVSLDS